MTHKVKVHQIAMHHYGVYNVGRGHSLETRGCCILGALWGGGQQQSEFSDTNLRADPAVSVYTAARRSLLSGAKKNIALHDEQ